MPNLNAKLGGKLSAAGVALKYISRRIMGVSQSRLGNEAVRTFKICESGSVPAITPFLWEKHLPRIQSAARYGAEHVIREHLHRKTFFFAPVIAYWLKNASLVDGSVYVGDYRHEMRKIGQRFKFGCNLTGPSNIVESAAIVSTCAGSTWFGHLIEDELPLQMLAENYSYPVSIKRTDYRDEAYYRQSLSLKIPLKFNVAIFNELLIIDEFAQNPNKTKRYRELRYRLSGFPKGNERVYLRRGITGASRVLVNEVEIIINLSSLGFKVVDIATASAEEIVASCRGASVVVSVEGSHLAPLLFLMRDFGTFIILNPPYQVHTTVADIGVFCGLSSGMFICEPVGGSRTDFRAEPNELMRFIDDSIINASRNVPRLERFLESVIDLDS